MSFRSLGLLLCLIPGTAAAVPCSLQLSSVFDPRQDLTVRADLRAGDWRMALAGTGGQHEALRAGISSPWVRAGPLSAAGVLREACNPLGFRAGSDVFVQRSGFLLDESFPSPPPGILLMPVARTLGVFWRSLEAGGEWAGGMVSVFQRPGAGFEGFLSVSDPPVEDSGEEWILSRPPFAGGRIMNAAARVLIEAGGLGVSTGLGTSLAERAPPGSYFHLHASARWRGLRLCLLLGSADPAYTTPSGDRPREGSVASAALAAEYPQGSLDLRFSRALGPGRSEAGFGMEKTVSSTEEALILARVQGSCIVHEEPEGSRRPSARCSVTAEAQVSPVRLAAGTGWNPEDGLLVLAGAETALGGRGSLAAFEGSVLHLNGGEAPAVRGFLSLQLLQPGFRVSLRTGLEEVRLHALDRDLPRGLRVSLGWKTSEISAPSARGPRQGVSP